MSGWRDGILALALVAASALLCRCYCAAAQAPARVPCGGDEIARGTAGHTIDGRTFVLDDGRQVRLAAIEVPPFPPQSGTALEGAAAKDALAALLAGAEVVLRRAEVQSTDRYGRIVAYAVVARGGSEHSAQADLVAAGLARVGVRIGSHDCAAELLGRENAARNAKLGVWRNSYYEKLKADNPAEVLAERGRFALVEGKVASVRESGATIYVNFGQRWTEDFTVTVLKRNERSFAAAGLELKKLAGRRVRVRGWIEERGGPLVEAAYPEQIELTDRE